MAEPAIAALCARYDCMIVGPVFCQELYAHLPIVPCQPNRVVLFKPSPAEGLRSLRFKQSVGLDRRWLLSDSVASQPGHRIDNNNRISAHLGAKAQRDPLFPGTAKTPELPINFALFIVGTNSPETVLWPQYSALAKIVNIEVLFAGGPGDEQRISALAMAHNVLPTDLSLSEFASVCRAANWIIGSDCGLMHLACASRPQSKNHFVVVGSTDPAQTLPRNAHIVMNERPSCWPCYRKSCSNDQACLQLTESEVLTRIVECL